MSTSPRILTIADAALIILVTALLAQLFGHTFWQGQANTAVVTDHLGQHHNIDMRRNQTLTVHGAIGDSTLQIAGERLRFTDSPCTNKLCVHSGWIKYGGEAVACLPNRLSVQLARTDNGFDAINF